MDVAMTAVDPRWADVVQAGIRSQFNFEEGWTKTRSGAVMWRYEKIGLNYSDGELLAFDILPIWNDNPKLDDLTDLMSAASQPIHRKLNARFGWTTDDGWTVSFAGSRASRPGESGLGRSRIGVSRQPNWRRWSTHPAASSTRFNELQLSASRQGGTLLQERTQWLGVDMMTGCVIGYRKPSLVLPRVHGDDPVVNPWRRASDDAFELAPIAVLRAHPSAVVAIPAAPITGHYVVPEFDGHRMERSPRLESRAAEELAVNVRRIVVTARMADGSNQDFEVLTDPLNNRPIVVRVAAPVFIWKQPVPFWREQELPNLDWAYAPESVVYWPIGGSSADGGWLEPIRDRREIELTRRFAVKALDSQMRLGKGTKDLRLVRLDHDDRLFKPNETLRRALLRSKPDLSPFGSKNKTARTGKT
jgi:hypothetical protein